MRDTSRIFNNMEVFCILIVLNSNSKVRLGKRIPRPDMYNQRTTLSVTTEVFMLPQFGKVKSKTIRNIKKTQNKLHIYKQFHFTVQREAFEETVEEKIFIQTAYAPYILPRIYIYIYIYVYI